MSEIDQTNQPKADAPLSINRLTAAFARMLGSPSSGSAPAIHALAEGDDQAASLPMHSEVAEFGSSEEISPQSIIEAVLFVGGSETTAHTAQELAAAMRDVSVDEVHDAVEQLNAQYDRDAAPYHIARSAEGYRLQLREELGRMRDKFYGRVKETTLSPAALEVLSVVAYRQPTTTATIDQLRGAKSGPLLSQLVRRGLVRLDRAADEPKSEAHYATTDRFLRLFQLTDVDQLPRAAELE